MQINNNILEEVLAKNGFSPTEINIIKESMLGTSVKMLTVTMYSTKAISEVYSKLAKQKDKSLSALVRDYINEQYSNLIDRTQV